MSNAAHALEPRVHAAASAIANARTNRRGGLAIENVLDILPPKLFAEVVEDARAALAAANVAAVQTASNLTDVYVDALRLDRGADSLLLLIRDRQCRPAGAFTTAGAGTMIFGHDMAATLWAAVAGRVRAEAASSLDQPEPQP